MDIERGGACLTFAFLSHTPTPYHPYNATNIYPAQDWKPLGAEQQLRQVRRVADAHLGQVAGGAEQQWCRLDSEQNHTQVSTFCISVIFF